LTNLFNIGARQLNIHNLKIKGRKWGLEFDKWRGVGNRESLDPYIFKLHKSKLTFFLKKRSFTGFYYIFF